MKQVLFTQLPTLGSATTYYHVALGKHPSARTSVTDAQCVVPTDGAIRNLRVRIGRGTPVGTVAVTLMKNGAATALAATVTAGAPSASDTTDSIDVAFGDVIAWRVVASAGGVTWLQLSFELEADAEGIAWHGWGGESNTISTGTRYQGALYGGRDNAWFSTTTQQDLVLAPGRIVALGVSVSADVGAGNTRAFTLLLNGTPLNGTSGTVNTQVLLSGSTRTGIMLCDVPVVAGDLLAIQHTGGSTGAHYCQGITVFQSSGSGWNLGAFQEGDSLVSTGAQFWQPSGFNIAMGSTAVGGDQSGHLIEAEHELIGGITPVYLSGLRVILATAPGSTAGYLVTLRKNQSSTPQELTLTSSTDVASTEAGVAVTAADRFTIRTLPAHSPTVSSRTAFVMLAQSSAVPVSALGDDTSTGGPIQGVSRVYLTPVNSTGGFTSTAVTVLAMDGMLLTVKDSGGSPVMTYGSTPDTAVPTWPPGQFLSSSPMVDIVHDRDLVAAFDGASARHLKSYDGRRWTWMGLKPGTIALTLNSTSGGALSSAAEFEVGYTFKHRSNGFESNGGDSLVSTITLSSVGSTRAIRCIIPDNGGIIPSFGNAGQDDADAVVAYARNKTAGETVRRRASSGPLNAYTSSGTFSTLTITSSNWTSNDAEPTDHTTPPKLTFAAVWKNRWWGASADQNNRLHFSQLYLNQAWPASYYIDLPFERGDGIRAFMPMGDVFVVFGYTQAFLIIGQTPVEFEVRPAMGIQEGAFGFRAVCKIEDGIIHGGASGVYLFDGQTDRFLSEGLEPAWRDLIQNTSGAVLRTVAIVYDRTRKEVRAGLPRKYPTGTRGEFVLDVLRTRQSRDGTPAWTDTDRPWLGYMTWDGPEDIAGNQHRLFAYASTRAVLVEENVGLSADGADQTMVYEGPGMLLGNVVARWIDAVGEYQPADGAFSVVPAIDGEDLSSITILISGGLARYGTAVYGKSHYPGAGRRQFYTAFELAAEGRSLQMQAAYVGQDEFIWYGYAPGVVPETQPRGFSE